MVVYKKPWDSIKVFLCFPILKAESNKLSCLQVKENTNLIIDTTETMQSNLSKQKDVKK